MTIDTLAEFQVQLEQMKDPRERRGFLDSFYAGLKHSDLSQTQVAEVGKAEELLRTYKFEPHARKLMINAGMAFLSKLCVGKLEETQIYNNLPQVNRIADSLESAAMRLEASDLIDFFTLQVVLMTPANARPNSLPLSTPMTQAKALATYVPQGYRSKSRFVVLPEDCSRRPREFELEGHQLCAGYISDGFMEIGTPSGPHLLGKAPRGIPSSATYDRLRDYPLRGIIILNYRTPAVTI